jgi:NADH-ubiquinone oxidoreductase chain 6
MFNTLDVISLLAILSGILTIGSKNPIVSVLFLIGLFACISIYLIILGLSFIGLSYLVVYIGAVSILFLFIIMLINIRISELQSITSNSIILSIIIGIPFNSLIFIILPYNMAIFNNIDSYLTNYLYNSILNSDIFNLVLKEYYTFKLNFINFKDNIFFVCSKIWDGNLVELNHITTIGNIMYTNYNIWLIIASFILLLAMVGTIVITIKPSPNNR